MFRGRELGKELDRVFEEAVVFIFSFLGALCSDETELTQDTVKKESTNADMINFIEWSIL